MVLVVDLVTITLVGGQIIRLCSGDKAVTVSGNTFTSLSPKAFIDRIPIKCTLGLAVDTATVTIRADPTFQPVSGIPFLQEIIGGLWDNALVLVERLFMPTYGDTSLGTIVWFKGRIGNITETGRTHVKFEVASPVELLNNPLPKNLIETGCRHVLYDAGCTLSAAAFSFSGSVLAGSNQSAIVTNLSQSAATTGPAAAPTLGKATPKGVNLDERFEFVVFTYVTALGETLASPESNLAVEGNKLLVVTSPPSPSFSVLGWNCYIGDAPGNNQLQNATPISIGTSFTEGVNGFTQGSPPPDAATNGYFAQGKIVFSTGPNAGITRLVRTYTNNGAHNVCNVIPPLPLMPNTGDAFTAIAGCDKRLATCINKFNNVNHFGGFPWVPDPSSVV